MPAAAEDLRPLVEAGGGGGEHDHIFLLQAQPAHPRGRVEGFCFLQHETTCSNKSVVT